MPDSDDEKKDEWVAPAVSLGHDGKIEGNQPSRGQRRPVEAWESRPVPVAPDLDQPLELDLPEPATTTTLAPRSRASRLSAPTVWLLALMTIALLAIPSLALIFREQVGAAFSGLRARLQHEAAPQSSEPAPPISRSPAGDSRPDYPPLAPPHDAVSAIVPTAPSGEFGLTILSSPLGATVLLEEQALGQTPYIGSHGVEAGKSVRVRLILPGYKPWLGTIKGGDNVKLEATLTRR